MLVPNGALRFEPEKPEEAGGVALGGEEFGLDKAEERATIGAGSRQTVHVLKEDGTLDEIEVVTGQSDGRHTVVTSRELKPGMKVVTSVKAAEG
jgi:HlyD family secretion protein